jgi:hypothetical protein
VLLRGEMACEPCQRARRATAEAAKAVAARDLKKAAGETKVIVSELADKFELLKRNPPWRKSLR